MTVKERLQEFRALMKRQGLSAYMVPSSDFHQSEYVGEFFKSRAFASGFTGSAGTLVVTEQEAALWTDGRYFIQAENELADSGIELMRMGTKGCPSVKEWLFERMPAHSVLGFDGRVVSAKEGAELDERLKEKEITIRFDYDVMQDLWKDRPSLPTQKAFLLTERYSGESFANKLQRVREKMQDSKATHHVISALDEIAWLFNIRGNDIAYSPVVLSFAVIAPTSVHLFIERDKLSQQILDSFAPVTVTLHPYEEVYTFVKNFQSQDRVLLNDAQVNYALYHSIDASVEKIKNYSPILFMKAIKNPVELANVRNAQIKDGVALTKFMYWLKNNVGKQAISELDAQAKIEELRKQQEGYIEPSFSAISAYKEHAAMMHYSATEETDRPLEAEHLYLLDSGGHYFEGSTDITRTFVLGPLNEELTLHFTSVVRAMINLSMAKFLYGCQGMNLDILSRGILWNLGIDYQCGTGHGIGYLLNVHEGPNGFRWRVVPERFDSGVLEEGMITTNEPGVYIQGSHGIRVENELVTRKAQENLYGQFMDFETITFVPIDLDGIDPALMNQSEIDFLNQYHGQVMEKIGPYLEEQEQQWLREYTRPIHK